MDISWGEGDVLSLLLERARTGGCRFELLPELRDINHVRGLQRLAARMRHTSSSSRPPGGQRSWLS